MTSAASGPLPDSTIRPLPLEYRPDIDGLRAIAVLLVVFFHAFPALAPGGFAGVDVFFVISGFLISSLLIGDLTRGRFSIRHFYARRIARIFPALLAVLAASLGFGWLALLADEYAQLGRHVAAGAGFVSNLVLWSESSYFDVAAETKPLLHLWSLGVEEQFYVVWPLILWAGWRMRAHRLGLVAGVAAISFALNIHAAGSDAVADFYSPYTRFWELLAGALIACLPARHWQQRPPVVAHLASCAGAALLIATLLVIDSSGVFPGWAALIPVTGSALLIYAGPNAAVNRFLLSHRALVAIGLISYPLYLWHWPLLAFARVVESATPPITLRLIAVLLAFILAWATYRFIETPVRRRAAKRPLIVAALAGLMLCLGIAGWTLSANGGVPERRGANPFEKYPNALGRDAYLTYIRNHLHRCADMHLRELSGNDPVYGYRCFQSQPAGPIDLLLVGDSHAEHLLPGLAEKFAKRNIASFIQPELPSIASPHFTEALRLISQNPDIKAIAISAFWFEKIPSVIASPEPQLRETFALLAATGKPIYLIDDIPMFPFDPEKCKYGRRFSGNGAVCEFPAAAHQQQKKYYFDVLTAALKGFDTIVLIDTDRFFCDESACSMIADGSLLYRDPHHLNIEGSKYLARMLEQNAALSNLQP